MLPLLFLAVSLLVVGSITWAEHRHHPGPTDWWRNLQAWAVDVAVGFGLMAVWPEWRGGALVDVATMPLWLALPLFLLVRDFLEFFYHYASHKVPALWAMHSLHHSDPEMTALTTNRHFWGDQLVKGLTIWPAMTMVTNSSYTLMLTYAVLSLYNYFIHANLRVDFGRWSWALNCPAYHRRHHSRLVEHYDSNFAALFPIWDVLFGTYRRPDGWPPSGLEEGAPGSFRELVNWPMRGRLDAQPVAAEAVAVDASPVVVVPAPVLAPETEERPAIAA